MKPKSDLPQSTYYATSNCSLGSVLIAASEVGLCSVLLADTPDALVREAQKRFSHAQSAQKDKKLEKLVATVIGVIEKPTKHFSVPLDLQGTLFQKQVWRALQKIPLGKTATYTDIAKRIGKPKSARAVAQACAANTIAVLIPCHRVIRSDGSLSGYRWGVQRKEALLEREQGK